MPPLYAQLTFFAKVLEFKQNQLVMQKFILNGKPEGISAPKSAFETVQGLVVEAIVLSDKIFVTKEELVKKLKEKRSIFSETWERATDQLFSFKTSDCNAQLD